jgi:hypothetical protein
MVMRSRFRPAAARAAVLAALALPAMIAQSAVVGRVQQGELVVTLHDTRDWCPEEGRSALWEQPQLTLKGCYVEEEGMVYLVWEDGDMNVVRSALFTQPGQPSRKPPAKLLRL